jgi:hypothetical protein
VCYQARELSSKEYAQFREGADRVWVTGEDPDEGKKRMIGTLNVKHDKKHEFILFDREAFLCNNEGKAVERFLVS